MKRLLSFILALALVAGMIPAVFATGTEENVVWSPVYNFTRSAFTTQPKDAIGIASWLVQYATDASLLNRNVSTGEWEYAGGYVSSLPSTSFQKEYLSIYNSFGSQNYAAIVFEITVDESGYYKPTFTYKKYNRANVLNMWIASKEEFDNTQTKYDLMVKDDINNLIYWWGDKGTAPAGGLMGTKIGSVDAYDVSESLLNGEYTNETPVYIAAGKYYLFIQPTKGKAWEKYSNGEQTASAVYLTPTSLTLTRQPTVETTVSKTTLAVGDSATLTSGVTSGENQDITATTEVTYTSSDRNVVQVSGNTITAVGEGTATITATAANGATDTVEITVTKYEVAPKSLSLYVDETDVGNVSVTVDGNAADVVTSVAQGATVKVTAKDTETHRFSHWLGTAGVASFDAEYTFSIYTNTALKAVYEEKPTETQAVVSFYKPNRELFATKVVNKNTTFGDIELATNNLSLVGYNTFLGWAIGEDENEEPIMIEDSYEITGDIGVVAVFDGKTAVTGITVDNTAKGDLVYGQPIELDRSGAANFRYWTKNDVVISYIKEFTHYAWQNDAKIKAVVEYSEAAKPVAVLESYDSDTWMFEYEIPENCARLEVGIIFGNSSDITVDSCYARAVSRRGAEEKHGQFTASSDYSVAKGYIIFKDTKDKVCVVYSK